MPPSAFRGLGPPRLPVCWLIAFAAGILLTPVVALPESAWVYLVAALVLAIALFWSPTRVWVALAVYSLPVLLFGMARCREVSTPAPDDVSTRIGRPSIWVRGVVEGEPTLLPGRLGHQGASLVLRVYAIGDGGATATASGRLRVTLADLRGELPSPGDALRLRGLVEAPPGVRNPNGFDDRAFLARRGILATLVARSTRDVDPVPDAGNGANWLRRWVHGLRRRLLASFHDHLTADDAALMGAVTLSTRAGVPADVTDALARDGALYILSTSGLHLGALTLTLTWVLRLVGVPLRIANAAALALLWVFVLASGANAPALRAGITLTILLAAPILRRTADPLHSLTVAAFVILVGDPLALYDVGFQLSFATIGTLLLYLPVLSDLLLPWEPGRPVWKRRALTVLEALLAGAVAQAGCWLLGVAAFHQLSWIAPVATVALGPLSVLVLFTGLAAAAVTGVFPIALVTPAWTIVHFLLDALRWVALAFGVFPGAAISVEAPWQGWILLYYILLWGSAPIVRHAILQRRLGAGAGPGGGHGADGGLGGGSLPAAP